MGEKLVVRPGAEIVVAIVVRDPSGTNYSPYTFANPSLAQVGISQPLNKPVLDHIDVIGGLVTGYRTPGAADYAGEWPQHLAAEPGPGDGAGGGEEHHRRAVIKTFNGSELEAVAGDGEYLRMSFRIPAVTASQYLRLRGTNLPAARAVRDRRQRQPAGRPRHQRRATLDQPAHSLQRSGTTQFDGCPTHLAVTVTSGQKYVSYDVAAWADLWFYSNPVYIEVTGRRRWPASSSAELHRRDGGSLAAPSSAARQSRGAFFAFRCSIRSTMSMTPPFDRMSHRAPAASARSCRALAAARWLREPLLHFVLLGRAAVRRRPLPRSRSDDPRTIVVGAEVERRCQAAVQAAREPARPTPRS